MPPLQLAPASPSAAASPKEPAATTAPAATPAPAEAGGAAATVLSRGASAILLVSGLLLETLVAALPFLATQLGGGTLALALLMHTAGCFLLARGLHSLLPPAQQRPRRLGVLYLFSTMFFIPLLGFLGLLGGVLIELYHPSQPPPPPPWLRVPIPELPNQPAVVSERPKYGDGALSAMLRYCPDPERRLSAVLAVRHLRDQNDAKVLRLALTDTVDDVRLLAYSILDRKEQAVNARIKSLSDELRAAAGDDARCATLEKRLAQTHFEMIEVGLCQGEVENYLLKKAHQHIEAALRLNPDDRESLFLLGSIALRQGDLGNAEAAFMKTQVKGMSLENVLPHLAELAFRQKRFAMVTNYLRAIEPIYFRAQPRLSGVALHWLKEERACLPKRLPT